MIRVGDVLHACVFAGCVACGALVAHYLQGSAMQGIGYGLVVWVGLMLVYLMVVRTGDRSGAQETCPAQTATVDDDATAFEVEDGKND